MNKKALLLVSLLSITILVLLMQKAEKVTVFINKTNNITTVKYITKYIEKNCSTEIKKLQYCNMQWIRFMNISSYYKSKYEHCTAEMEEKYKSCYCAPCETKIIYEKCMPYEMMCSNVIGMLNMCKRKLKLYC